MSITDRATPALEHVPRAVPPSSHPLNVGSFTTGALLPTAPILILLILLSEEYSSPGSGAAEHLPHQRVWPQHSQISISTPASPHRELCPSRSYSVSGSTILAAPKQCPQLLSHMQSSPSSGPLATATVTVHFWRPANLSTPLYSKLTEDPKT